MPKSTSSETNPSWPPPCPEHCPNCSAKMSRTAMVDGGKHAVLIEGLGFWYCLECAIVRAASLGIEVKASEYNRYHLRKLPMVIRYSPLVAQFMVDNMRFLSQQGKVDTYVRLRGLREIPPRSEQ